MPGWTPARIACSLAGTVLLAACAQSPALKTDPGDTDAAALFPSEGQFAGLSYQELDSILSWQQFQQGLEAADQGDWLEAQYYFDLALAEFASESSDDKYRASRYSSYSESMPMRLAVALEETYLHVAALATPDSTYGLYEDIELPIGENEDFNMDSAELREIRSFLDTLDLRQFSLPLSLNDRVLEEIHFLTHKVRSFTEGSLTRKTAYEAMIRTKLQERGMPEDLLYLSLVESGFKGKAYSRAKASGLWQFIPATARRYGLRVDYWVDERRDPEKATEAALGYLSALYSEFKDWHLAMAAYNCGEGRVRRALRDQGNLDFWAMSLPKETMHYVPRILAATIVGRFPHHYGFEPGREELMAADTLTVSDPIPLQTIADSLGVSVETLRDLNLELNRWSTPADGKPYLLKLPLGSREQFASIYDSMDKSKLARYQFYIIRKGDNLGAISRRFGVTVAMLRDANGLKKNAILRIGQSLMIPVGGRPDAVYAPDADDVARDTRKSKDSYNTHKVRRGETLSEIARRYGVSTTELQNWNGLDGSSIRAGQTLRLRPASQTRGSDVASGDAAGKKTVARQSARKAEAPASGIQGAVKPSAAEKNLYHVREGDNLFSLARRFGVPMRDLLAWNNLEEGAQIQVGQKLRLRPPPEDVAPNAKSKQDKGTASSGRWYTVRKGDTLWDIARKNGVDIRQIQEWNNLSDSKVKPGMKLQVGE